jgi:phosphatidate phosphatase PAH1
MAHFAKIGLNSKVIEVLSLHNNELKDSNGIEQEANGIDFLTKLTGYPVWKQTSYNSNFRKNFAGIGYTYDEDRDAFIPKKPFNSWVLNETTCLWESPIPYPQDNNRYNWNEQNQSWDLIENNI